MSWMRKNKLGYFLVNEEQEPQVEPCVAIDQSIQFPNQT